jgi:hypothetical protein
MLTIALICLLMCLSNAFIMKSSLTSRYHQCRRPFYGRLLTHCRDNDEKSVNITSLLTNKLSLSINVKNDPNYVKRSFLENQIQSIYDNRDILLGDYHVVYGVEGAGKSYLLASVLEDKEGVIQVDVDHIENIVSIHGCKIAKGYTSFIDYKVDFSLFNSALKRAMDTRGGLPLLFVFEVEPASSTPEIIKLVKNIAKNPLRMS